ncbi:kinase-like domain-containing protein [Gigaspora margarita]|uniref:Kinase-like domain-containing protein n=1 Tax=Gigaspora margarita TaxID=4874 RepID=A0A8H3WZZ4_GIGMA|nr:kinase-like domain-containing protein [Gigaspora margarita]
MTSRNSMFHKILRKVFSVKHQDIAGERSISIITTSDDDNNNYNQNNNLLLSSINTPDRTSTGARRDWRSGFKQIDELIHEMRLEYPDPSQHLIWIPFSEFMKCKQINCGGFSIIYEATWIPSGQTVALKCLKDSQDISLDFLNEIKSHWVLFLQPQFLRCYGITQQPSTGEFMMVTQYAPNDNSLDSCMRKNSKKSHFGRLHNKKVTHPDAVYHSRLLDFKEIKEMRLRQYLSLNLPHSTYDQDFLEEISQLENDTDNQSQPSHDVTNNLQPSRDDHNPRNTYNFTSNIRNSFASKYLPRSKETFKISSPTRDIYSFLPQTPKQYNGSTTNISKSFEADKSGTSGRPNAASVFIPEDDIQALQTFWALNGANSSRSNLSI